MRRLLLIAGCSVVSLAGLAVSSDAHRWLAARMLVPAYFDPPGHLWRTALRAPDRTLLIVNPNNGPGTRADPAYRQLVADAKRTGHELIGYVYTDGGARPISSVELDLGRWASFYGVRDIFFDEVSQSAAQLPYYRTVTAYARAHGARVIVLNPGTVPARGYFGLGAIVVTFEDTYAAYRRARFPAWLRREPAGQQANIVYAVPNAAQARRAMAAMRAHGVGVGYVTGAGGDHGNPYATLPRYYNMETQWLAASPSALASRSARDAKIAGRVIECNTPSHCFTGHFSVSALNSHGHVVGTTFTHGTNNHYLLHVVPSKYELVAKLSGGLRCEASAVARAHRTVQQNITCLVP